MIKYVVFSGKLTCLTGLRIGGSSDVVEIGGLDNPIIRDPVSKKPYIPGSSLKGKMRALLELDNGKLSNDGNPCQCGRCNICLLFGTSASVETDQGPTRLLFRDSFLTEESCSQLKEKEVLNFTEVKTEVNINRWLAKPLSGPRKMERIPAGSEFNFRLDLRLLNDNDKQRKNEYIQLVKRGLELLENDALGSSGSRGYGRIKIEYKLEEDENI